jgi:hypothetical protein
MSFYKSGMSNLTEHIPAHACVCVYVRVACAKTIVPNNYGVGKLENDWNEVPNVFTRFRLAFQFSTNIQV